MKTLEAIQRQLSLGEFDFSRHALKRVVERNISELEIKEAGINAKITEVNMFRCHVCGSTEAKKEYVNEIFQIDNKPVLVERIPAVVCVRCGEETFSRETTERIRQIVHGEAKSVKSISMEVFTFV